jgi:hypothetical protein
MSMASASNPHLAAFAVHHLQRIRRAARHGATLEPRQAVQAAYYHADSLGYMCLRTPAGDLLQRWRYRLGYSAHVRAPGAPLVYVHQAERLPGLPPLQPYLLIAQEALERAPRDPALAYALVDAIRACEQAGRLGMVPAVSGWLPAPSVLAVFSRGYVRLIPGG